MGAVRVVSPKLTASCFCIKQVPSEFKISEKWDVCLERTVINFGIGVVAAGLAGVVLTRECSVRNCVQAFTSQVPHALLSIPGFSLHAFGSISHTLCRLAQPENFCCEATLASAAVLGLQVTTVRGFLLVRRSER